MNSQESAEMYLETILILEKKNGTVRAIDIAHHMQFSRPTVSQQIIARGFHAVQMLAEGQPLPELPLLLIRGNTSAAR